MTVKIITSDCRDALPALAAGSVQCVVTSPPYWGLRDYGLPASVWGGDAGCAHVWGEEVFIASGRKDQDRDTRHTDGRNPATQGLVGCPKQLASTGAFCQRCGAWRGCLGLEPTPELYIQHMVEIFREVRRVLRDDGTVWLNLGDSYASNPKGNKRPRTEQGNGRGLFNIPSEERLEARRMKQTKIVNGLKPKDLCGIPWRVALALQADGWWLRSDIIWHKPNPMPESVRDRPTKSHEYVFLLTKRARYYYDADAIREPHSRDWTNCGGSLHNAPRHRDNPLIMGAAGEHRGDGPPKMNPAGRNRRTVWTANPQMWQLRSDLSDDDRAYVLGEFCQRGLLSSNPNSSDDHLEGACHNQDIDEAT